MDKLPEDKQILKDASMLQNKNYPFYYPALIKT